MKKPAEPSTPSGPPIREKKATDHELRKHDKFTRYGQQIALQALVDRTMPPNWCDVATRHPSDVDSPNDRLIGSLQIAGFAMK
jgi:hypothetical protein